MGIQSARVTSRGLEMSKFPPFFLALTVCPYDDGCKTVVHLDTCLIPFRLESSSSVEFGSRKPPLENPLTHTTNSLPAPSARPPQVARRGLFLSAIFRKTHPGPSLELPESMESGRGNLHSKIHRHTLRTAYQPPSPDRRGRAEGAFFVSDFSLGSNWSRSSECRLVRSSRAVA